MAGEIQLNSTSFASESSGTITINNATLASAVDLSNHYASTSEVQGTHTTFSGSHSDTATTINLASVSGISAGDYVVGEGITPGTTVSSVGASSVVISAGLDTDSVGIAGGEPISFYKSNKVLSPGLVAGALCRAWVNFDGDPVSIKSSFNVSSMTDSATGLYVMNFVTAMPDVNYCAVYGDLSDNGSGTVGYYVGTHTINGAIQLKSTTQLQMLMKSQTGSDADGNDISVAIFR
jgi:hypothetical protein